MNYFVKSTVIDQGAASDTRCGPESLKDIVDFVGATNDATVVFESTAATATTYTLTTSETVSANMFLKFWPGAVIDGAGTLTLDNPGQIIAAPGQNIFGASVTVVFTNPGMVYPEWWYVSGTYAAAVVKANISGGGTLDFTGTTYDLEGIAALDATITKDVKWISSNRQATLTNVLTEKLEFPTGINVHYDGLKFDTWWSPMDTYFTYTTLTIKNCYFNNVKRACYAWDASVYANSSIGRVEIVDNVVIASENGFIVKSKVGSARVSGNYIEDIESSTHTYAISVGDHDDDTSTLQANTTNINISDNVIKQVNSTGAGMDSHAIAVMGTNVVIADNVIEDIDGVGTDDVEAIYTKAINLSITGNTIIDVDGTSGAITLKGWLYTEADLPKGDKTIVSNNTIFQSANTCDYGINVSGGSLPNTIISNNVIEGAEDVGIVVSGSNYNLMITDNIISNCGGEGGIIVWGPFVERCVIGGNLIEDVTGKAAAFANGVKVRTAETYIKDLVIRDNMIRIDALVADTTGVKGIDIQPTAASEDIQVINNNLQLTHDTNAPYGVNIHDAVAIDNIFISGNQFHNIENVLRAITFNSGYALYTTTDYIANITNASFVDNYAGLRLVEPSPQVIPEPNRAIRIIYDFAESGGTVGNHAIEASDIFPSVNVLITRAWYLVTTTLASATTAATLGISFPAAADENIHALEDISTSGTTGVHDTIVNDAVANFLRADTPGDITLNVGVEEITAGILNLFIEYVEYR